MEIILIFILGLAMGLVSAICGGSGVFGVPTMLAFGLPPINVLALNRTSDIGVISGAIRKFHKAKSIDWKLAGILSIPLLIGSFIGASVVVRLPQNILKYIMVLGVGVGIFFLLKRTKIKTNFKKGKISLLGLFFMVLVGFWSGSLAMAGATFAVLVMVYFFHKNFLEARSTDIVASIPETIISTIILIINSTVSVYLLISMVVSSAIGAWIGAHIAIKKGSEFIRQAMVLIAFIMVIKVIVDIIGISF